MNHENFPSTSKSCAVVLPTVIKNSDSSFENSLINTKKNLNLYSKSYSQECCMFISYCSYF